MWKTHQIPAGSMIAGSSTCGKHVEKVASLPQGIYTY